MEFIAAGGQARSPGGFMKAKNLAAPFRVTGGKGFRLKDFDPRATPGPSTKERSAEILQTGLSRLAELQAKLYADDRWSLLLIFQAMDAAGKDSTIKHVMSAVNPQGCQVYSFKAPSAEELDHDFLWRTDEMPSRAGPHRHLQPLLLRGSAGGPRPSGVSERTEVCRTRAGTSGRNALKTSMLYERYLSRNGTMIRKFFLNVSRDEQKKRFLERLDEPEKNWKFSTADVKERQRWDEYMSAYEDMIRNTAHCRGAMVRGPRRPEVVHAAGCLPRQSLRRWRALTSVTRRWMRRSVRN